MTRNQIEYWGLKENKRHNQVSEGEINRHNVATERIDLGKLQETNRHNVVTENETHRHNVRTEDQTDRQLDETQRHNLATEGLTGTSLNIEAGKLSETIRHNQATENISDRNLSISAGVLGETERHNLVSEEQNYMRIDAQNTYDLARADLTEVQTTWEGLKNSQHVKLTDAQIRQIDQMIAQSEAQIDLINQQITNGKYTNALGVANTVIKGLDSIAHMVDALIPG